MTRATRVKPRLSLALAGQKTQPPTTPATEPVRLPEGIEPEMIITAAERLVELGNFEQAADFYKVAAACLPADADIRYNVGTCCMEMGNAAEAEKFLRECLKIDALHAAARYNLASVLYQNDRAHEGAGVLRMGLRLHIHEPDLHHLMALCLEKEGKTDEALAHWDTYARMAPKSDEAKLARAIVARGSTGATHPQTTGKPEGSFLRLVME